MSVKPFEQQLRDAVIQSETEKPVEVQLPPPPRPAIKRWPRVALWTGLGLLLAVNLAYWVQSRFPVNEALASGPADPRPNEQVMRTGELVITHHALFQYQEEHGQLVPDRLEELVPKYLEAIPAKDRVVYQKLGPKQFSLSLPDALGRSVTMTESGRSRIEGEIQARSPESEARSMQSEL